METVDLIACVFGVDGDELYGCTDDVIMGQHLSFWNIYGRDTFTLYRLKDVPILTAEHLVDHGADFYHQGGYQFPSDAEAWETAESYISEKVEEYSFGDETEGDSVDLIDQSTLKVGMIQKHQPSMSHQNSDLRPSLVRVADRYMVPSEVPEYESKIKTARSLDDAPFIEAQEDYERKLDAFDQSIEDFLDLVERAVEKQNGRKPNRGIVRETASDKSWLSGSMGRVMRNKFSHSWVPLANAGVKLMDLGMDRKIPKSKARRFTAFSRLWGSARSVPRNVLTWQERHRRTLDFGREMILNSEGHHQ